MATGTSTTSPCCKWRCAKGILTHFYYGLPFGSFRLQSLFSGVPYWFMLNCLQEWTRSSWCMVREVPSSWHCTLEVTKVIPGCKETWYRLCSCYGRVWLSQWSVPPSLWWDCCLYRIQKCYPGGMFWWENVFSIVETFNHTVTWSILWFSDASY